LKPLGLLQKCLEQTAILRIVHQTWKSTNIEQFPDKALEGVEKWLGYATIMETNMAYFMWDDSGVRELLRTVDSGCLQPISDNPPAEVEVPDIFRVIVCTTIGGVISGIL
jgi:mannosyltransferase OCH1-like enzyme